MSDGLIDLGGLTDAQLQRAGLAIGGLLSDRDDRAVALGEIRKLRAEQMAATPPRGLTVERLAALLLEWSRVDDDTHMELFEEDEWAAALAAWLLPKLGP